MNESITEMEPVSEGDLTNELQRLLEEAIRFDEANKGLIQIFDGATGLLTPVAQIGFHEEFLALFKEVRAFDPSACGRALGLKCTIVIDNVLEDISFIPFKSVIVKEDFKSVKSIPLFNSKKQIVGMISTHFAKAQYHIEQKREIPQYHLQKIIAKLENI